MLEFYFKYPRVLRRLRDGELGGEMDRIADKQPVRYQPKDAVLQLLEALEIMWRLNLCAAPDPGVLR